MTDLEDQLRNLMVRGLEGDAVAHRRLLAELSVRLRAYFGRRLTGGSADVEDLVQETLIAVHTRRGTYDPGQPLTAWAYAIARYKLVDHFRRSRVRKHVPLEDAGALFAPETADEGAIRRDLDAVLSALPERQRSLMQDVKIEGRSVAEAAARVGMSVTAAKVSLHRGMKLLGLKVKR